MLSLHRECDADNPIQELLTALQEKKGKQSFIGKLIQGLKKVGKTELAKKIKEAISTAQVLDER